MVFSTVNSKKKTSSVPRIDFKHPFFRGVAAIFKKTKRTRYPPEQVAVLEMELTRTGYKKQDYTHLRTMLIEKFADGNHSNTKDIMTINQIKTFLATSSKKNSM